MAKFLNDIPKDNSFDGDDNPFSVNKSVLENIIVKDEIQKNKIIALSGKWGSGKSTIIKMVNDDDTNKIDVVEFDVLNYSEDQIRRSFLINLYKKLKISDNNDFSRTNRTNLEKYITGNIKEYSIKENTVWKNITKILILLSLSYVSILAMYKLVSFIGENLAFWIDEKYKLINGFISFDIFMFCILIFIIKFMIDKYRNENNINKFSLFFTRIIFPHFKEIKLYNKTCIFLVLLIVLIVINVILFYCTNFKNNYLILSIITLFFIFINIYILVNNSEFSEVLWKNILDYLFPFVNGKSNVSQTNTEETESSDVTGLEFKEYYKEIIRLYFSQKNKDHNLLIVIDNLDRLKTDKIKNIVYNLSLFLSSNDEYLDDNQSTNKGNIYFCVLVDKDSFFRNNVDSNEEIKHNSEFFEKIFPIRLEMSNIINLNWREFFREKIDEAFENDNIDNNVIEKTIWLYEEFSNLDIVPRDIIYFINKVVYNYKVMEEGHILDDNNKYNKNLNNNKFKASSINALYTMFVEERKYFNYNSITEFVKAVKSN
ncbi:P-loop NTPase fold protein [Brachyspira alvinipulli]|uniref:P-loop NTPase fold protein n=1 Tax=Brachyspira alvinipulli TaxID=84379 RepID=UPI0030055255